MIRTESDSTAKRDQEVPSRKDLELLLLLERELEEERGEAAAGIEQVGKILPKSTAFILAGFAGMKMAG